MLLGSIDSIGQYCFSLTAVDDDIVEDQETFTISVFQDGSLQDSVLSVFVTDNDSKIDLLS